MSYPTSSPVLPHPFRELVLGSTSPFRRELLQRLGLEFATDSPDVDETRQDGEDAKSLVLRLSEAKAREVATRHPDALVIGSDQVACLEDGTILGKPGSEEKAFEQLRRASGGQVQFLTGLALYNSHSGRLQACCEPFTVQFRKLSDSQIQRYITLEKPLNCAGSFKSEGLGICLFERLAGDDPNSLVGLPLIRLVSMLHAEGIVLP